MKRVWKSSISVLLAVLMVCSLITVTLPTSVTIKATESAPTSKWTTGLGAEILSESSTTWVTDTAVITLTGGSSYVQLDQLLTELVGRNGEDGRAYVQIIPENPLNVFAFAQLVTKPDATSIVPESDVRAMTWYMRSNETPTFSTIHLRGSTTNRTYGYYADCADEGYVFSFTTTADGKVAIRGSGKKTGSSFDSYADTTNLISVKKLAELEGVGTKSGEDGVYFRLQSFNSNYAAEKFTVKVVYPKPEKSTLDANKTSRWTAGGGAAIISETSETMVHDTVRVDLKAEPGFVQHQVKLTELIGSNGADGKGYIEFVPDDVTNDFSFLQLVGDPSITTTVQPNVQLTSQGLTWYFRSHENLGVTHIYLRETTNKYYMAYGKYTDTAGAGYRLAFTQTQDGSVAIRGLNDGASTEMKSYDTTTILNSFKTLSQIQGVGTATGEDGLYFRIQSFGGSARNQKHTITVVYPEPEDAVTPEFPGEAVNLVPEDIFSSPEKAALWFKGAMHTDASYYTVEDGEYVMQLPRTDAWTYSTRIPTGEFTAEFEICPVAKDNGALGNIGVMLGKAAGNGFPWYLTQVQFRPQTSNSYITDGVFAQHWYHSGQTEGTHNKVYASEPMLIGSDYVTTPQWYKVRIEVGNDKSLIYINDILLPDGVQNYMLTRGEVKWLGFWPEGSSNGFKIKNYKLYEGVQPIDKFIPEDVLSGYDTARVWFNGLYNNEAYYTEENGEYVMRVPATPNDNVGWVQTIRKIPYTNYTVSYDFAMNELNDTKLAGAGHIIGTGTRAFYSLRFDGYTNGKLQFRIVELYYDTALGKEQLAIKQDLGYILEGLDFSSKKWFNLKYEVTEDSFRIFLDGSLIYSSYIDGKLSSQNIKYFGLFPEGGTVGFDVKNYSITDGVHIDGDIKTAAPELNEAITLHFSADVDADSAESVRMKFTFKGEDIWVDGVEADGQYTFSLPDILPQDMCENISAELYIDGMRKDKVASYSLQEYCMNLMPTADEAAADAKKQDLRNLLIALLNYGTESQKYFEGITDASLFANSQLEEADKISVNQDMANADSVKAVGERGDANNYWKSASLALYDTVQLRFKFVTDDASKITIKVGDKTYTNFELSTGNIYFWDYDEVYANQFDKPVVVGLYVDGELVQEVTYSINTYVNVFNAANDTTSKSYAIVQAVYDYGCMAQAYNV